MASELEIFLKDLHHSRKTDIRNLYSKISSEFPNLESEIKWNAPSLKLNGTNVVTFRIFPDPAFQIILHFGSKKAPENSDFKFEITRLHHRWADSTRCVVTIDSDLDWPPLKKVIGQWLTKVSS